MEPDLSHLDAEDLALRERILADRKRREKQAERKKQMQKSSGGPAILSKYGSRGPENDEDEDEDGEKGDEPTSAHVSSTDNANDEEGNENGESSKKDENEDEDEDGFDDAETFRRKRIAELKKQHQKMQEHKIKGHGEYREIDEPDFLTEVTSSDVVACMFYHADFESCKVFDHHLKEIAKKHLEFKIIKINAEKAQFFVPKLAIRVLPTIIIFHKGVAIDRVVGCEDLGGTVEFSTEMLEARLGESGVITVHVDRESLAEEKAEQARQKKILYSRSSTARKATNSDDDDY
eukprot:ANDGO_04053.mRNA.1 Thioredoxin domain-containing protein PLP3B